MNSRNATISKLIFEFIVIVVGVLTAFGLQTISESFSDNATKKKYLIAIKRELDTNTERIDQVVQRRTNQEDSTKMLIRILSSKQKDEKLIMEHMTNFYWLHDITCKLGAYEAFKTSPVFDKLENIELITRLNNLDAQITSIQSWQSRVQDISIDLFIFGNDDALDLSDYKPEFDKVFSAPYIRKIKYLMATRTALTNDFLSVKSEMVEIERMIDREVE